MDRLEALKRDVLQLLKEYQTWNAAYGGARPWDEQHVAMANYGPPGMIFEGTAYGEYPQRQRDLLAQSYRALDYGLTRLRGDGPMGYEAWGILNRAYLRDEADPSIVGRWREWEKEWEAKREELARQDELAFIDWLRRRPDPETSKWRESKPSMRLVRWLKTHHRPQSAEFHDLALGQLTHLLRGNKLYPIEPKRLTESQNKTIENDNAEMYANYQRIRASGKTHREAVKGAAEDARVTTEYIERIIEFRDTLKPKTCIEAGCDKPVYSQNRCSRHYQQDLKRRKGKIT